MICPACHAENRAPAERCLTCGRPLGPLAQGAMLAGRYEIVGLLGEGGMGTVFKAHDHLLDEPIAIKVLRGELVRTPEMNQRFRSEIKLARRVSHPNVCRIHEYGEHESLAYISMALLEGTDLRQRMAGFPEGLPVEEAFDVALQGLEGLRAIHDVGILHRDLKAANFMMDARGVVRLMDFGIAKDCAQLTSDGLTATGQVMGTPEYMSPEQCRGQPLDFRSDVYSMGIVIFELFTGQVPLRGDGVVATLFKQVQEPVRWEEPPAARLPAAVAAVLRKALAKDPAQRQATATELLEALRRARAGAAPVPAVSRGAAAVEPVAERRRHTRLGTPLDVILKRASPGSTISQQERTVAEDIGRGGVRVLTGLDGVAAGDELTLEEIGGDFRTRVAVRSVFTGADGIPRLGLEFLDRPAPDRLVPHDDARPSRTAPGARAPRPIGRIEAESHSRPPPPAGSAPPAGGPAAARRQGERAAPRPDERRRDTRLDICVDVRLKTVGADPGAAQEERTVADNISRGGARVLTSMTRLTRGDVVWLGEVGGDFETRAAVRFLAVGSDNIPRLGLKFLDRSAPDRLVLTDDARISRSTPALRQASGSPRTPAGAPALDAELQARRTEILETYVALKTRSHFELLDLPRACTEEQVRSAYARLARRYHPDVPIDPRLADLREEINAIFVRLGDACEVLTHPARRAEYESRLGRSRKREEAPAAGPARHPAHRLPLDPRDLEAPAPRAVAREAAPRPSGEGAAAPPAPPEARATARAPQPTRAPTAPPPVDHDQELLQAEGALIKARKLMADQLYWDAIQALEPALDVARGTELNRRVRVLHARAVAKNPNWLKRAERLLLALLDEQAGFVEGHIALAEVYGAAGLAARARSELERALALEPGHRAAAAALASLRKG